jgi:hypothetical protein
MKTLLFRRLTVLVLVVAGLAVGASTATAAPGAALPAKAALTATVFNLDGTYTDGGTTRPVISAPGDDTLRVNISGRPTATGVVLDSATIIVSFPDDTTYTAKLLAPGTIRWSNGSTWTKLTLRAPSILDLKPGAANTAIRNAGMTVGASKVLVDGTCEHNNTVMAQNPAAGTFVVAGQTMNYTIGVLPKFPCF